jgi:hypothetical protein
LLRRFGEDIASIVQRLSLCDEPLAGALRGYPVCRCEQFSSAKSGLAAKMAWSCDFAEPVELLGHAGSCTCAPHLTSLVPSCAPRLTPLVPSRAPLLTPLHANGLGLGIGTRQCCGGCCDGEGGNFSEKGKSPSTGDRLRFDDFVHGQDSTEAGECPSGCRFQMPVLI